MDKIILPLRRPIEKYLSLMERFHKERINAFDNELFRRNFNGFYRMGLICGVSEKKYNYQDFYFNYLEKHRDCTDITFEQILTDLTCGTGFFTPSFSSKLLATINPHMAVWDSFVANRCGVKLPSRKHPTDIRIKEAVDNYRIIQNTIDAKKTELLKVFYASCKEQNINDELIINLTDTKKVDLVLWLDRQKKS